MNLDDKTVNPFFLFHKDQISNKPNFNNQKNELRNEKYF